MFSFDSELSEKLIDLIVRFICLCLQCTLYGVEGVEQEFLSKGIFDG